MLKQQRCENNKMLKTRDKNRIAVVTLVEADPRFEKSNTHRRSNER
jgi:hypothetical protein